MLTSTHQDIEKTSHKNVINKLIWAKIKKAIALINNSQSQVIIFFFIVCNLYFTIAQALCGVIQDAISGYNDWN